MFKQYIAIILLCIFNFILVGHSIIPHEHTADDAHTDHHRNHVNSHSHSHNHHHHTAQIPDHQNEDDNKKEKDGLSDFFSLVIHVSEFVRSENFNPTTEQTQQKEECQIAAFSFLPTRSFLATDQKSEDVHYRDPDYYPPPNLHKGLRAPPLFFS